MVCELCKQRYPKIDGSHYDEGGFLPCEDEIMHNPDQAEIEREELYNDAVQSKIRAILSQDGPLFCGQVATKVDKSPQETRWHLTEFAARGEVEYNWISKRYAV